MSTWMHSCIQLNHTLNRPCHVKLGNCEDFPCSQNFTRLATYFVVQLDDTIKLESSLLWAACNAFYQWTWDSE